MCGISTNPARGALKMEKSIFQFIWKYSKRNQLALTAITLLTFPILYASLELPKRIINDAIGGTGEDVFLLSMKLSQTQFLMLLCVGFLLSVLANGLLKMHLNTMKGVLSERLLRRFRFQLVARMLKFPRSYFRTTSQGELVSMVTSEAEPMGSFMGNMLSQPVFQAGQILTILVFLFAQSFWFGVASIALIPLQAWIIPKLQRQINVLNKERIKEVRKFAADIGETAARVSDIRMNGGTRHRLSLFSNRLGNLFSIRFKIYQKKFFMKFLNNFINQLTPFFFYSVGGYLAIKGEVTVGALIAALAAYKDLSSPWKELLAYYNQTQDMVLRWELVIERFAPKNLEKDTLFDGGPHTFKNLRGYIAMKGITVNFVEHDVNYLHQTLVVNRIGDVSSKPYIFQGTLGEILFKPFNYEPVFGRGISVAVAGWKEVSTRAANNVAPFESDRVAPQMAKGQSCDESKDIDDIMVRKGLRTRLELDIQQETNLVLTLQDEAFYHRLGVFVETKRLAGERVLSPKYFPVTSVLGNAIFERISTFSDAREKCIEDIIVDVLKEHCLRLLVAQLLYNVVTIQGGEHLFAVFRERLAIHDADTRTLTHKLMPDTT